MLNCSSSVDVVAAALFGDEHVADTAPEPLTGDLVSKHKAPRAPARPREPKQVWRLSAAKQAEAHRIYAANVAAYDHFQQTEREQHVRRKNRENKARFRKRHAVAAAEQTCLASMVVAAPLVAASQATQPGLPFGPPAPPKHMQELCDMLDNMLLTAAAVRPTVAAVNCAGWPSLALQAKRCEWPVACSLPPVFILSLNRAEQFGVLLQNHLHDYDGPIVCVLNNAYDSESRALQVCAIAQRSH